MSWNVDFFVDTPLQSNEEKSETTILESAWEKSCLVGQRFDINGWIGPCKLFETVSFSMRFPGHETVSIWNRVRVNEALVTNQPEDVLTSV